MLKNCVFASKSTDEVGSSNNKIFAPPANAKIVLNFYLLPGLKKLAC